MVCSDIFVDRVSIQGCRSKHYNCILISKSTVFTPHLDVFLTDPPTMEQLPNVKVEESKNVRKECNVASGTPPLDFFWKNVKTGRVTTEKLLTIINIRRNQSGEYRCIANNTCGNESAGMFIDVYCKNLYNVFTRLSNVCYSMLVSVLYNCVLSHRVLQCLFFPVIVI